MGIGWEMANSSSLAIWARLRVLGGVGLPPGNENEVRLEVEPYSTSRRERPKVKLSQQVWAYTPEGGCQLTCLA